MDMARGLGYLPDRPDARDRPFALARPIGAAARPAEVRLEEHLSEILDQGATSSCVAHAYAAAIAIRESQAGLSYEPVSRAQLYYDARAYDGYEQEDTGTFLRSAAKALAKRGVGPETAWPLDPAAINRQPPPAALGLAHPRRGGTYTRIAQTGAARVEAVLDALAAGHPVVFGTLVTYAFMEYAGAGLVTRPEPGALIAGGHAMCLCGYDAHGTRLRVVNSWSAAWGERGLWWMGQDYLAWSETSDLWTVDGWRRIADRHAELESEVTS